MKVPSIILEAEEEVVVSLFVVHSINPERLPIKLLGLLTCCSCRCHRVVALELEQLVFCCVKSSGYPTYNSPTKPRLFVLTVLWSGLALRDSCLQLQSHRDQITFTDSQPRSSESSLIEQRPHLTRTTPDR